jgi:uncharacterized membrane protein YciS (DUF1049 family)
MRQEVSVNNAIRRGHLIVNVPVALALIGCPAFAFYLSEQNIIPEWGIGVAFLIGFILAWLIWSFMITKWRIWAFENVRNVHELKKRAIEAKLIWDDGNIFEKTEIRSRDDKRKLEKLENKFEKEDVFREDYSIPPKIEIYYSKWNSYLELGVSVLITAFGAYLLFSGAKENYLWGTIAAVVGLYSFQKELRKARHNKKPQIIMDSKGIQTKNVDFKEWSVITDEEIVQEGIGKSAKSYLVYFYDEDRFEKIEINALNVKYIELENMLRTYRIRHAKNRR